MAIAAQDLEPSVARARLEEASRELSSRGLYIAARWAAELLVACVSPTASAGNAASQDFSTSTPSKHSSRPPASIPSLPDISFHRQPSSPDLSRSFAFSPVPKPASRPQSSTTPPFKFTSDDNVSEHESSLILLAKTYFDSREFSRASFTLSSCSSDLALFLRLYAKYLDEERCIQEEGELIMGPKDKMRNDLRVYKDILSALAGHNDPFLLYLKGVVLNKVGDRHGAIDALVSSVNAYPYNWSCWLKLASLIDGADELNLVEARLPQSFMSSMFSVHAVLEIHSATETLQQNINDLLQTFPRSLHLKAQQALIYYHLREFDDAEALFDEIYAADPCRVDDVDTYSNILYVMENRAKLSALAHKYIRVDRNRPETCCLVGNYFSLRGEHERAVAYFRRALKLDRGYLSAWTLMGHEYVELKNTHAAVEAYRRAVDVNRKDYRAWYGLGQTYELMDMHFYALSYYQRAATLRPYDARMWFALGSCYERLKKLPKAIECFKRSMMTIGPGDVSVASRLASLEEQLSDLDNAAMYHSKVVETGIEEKLGVDEYVGSCLWIARWEMNREGGDLRHAESLLERCMNVGTEEKEEAQALRRMLQLMQV